MIDWSLAAQLAERVSTLPGATRSRDREAVHPELGPQLREAAAESERLISDYTGLRAGAPLPVAEAVDRPEWIRANLDGMAKLLDPVTGRLGENLGPARVPVQLVGGTLLAVEVGVIVGFLAGRVLGQYEVVLIDPDARPRLLFVEPNLGDAVHALEAERDELIRWVALHEVTHALQFGAVPWLREHLAGMVRELLDGLTVSIDPARLARLPSGDDLRSLVDAVRDGDVISFVAGPQQKAIIDRMQATMAVVEGHAEHVMDAVGADVLPTLPHLREAMDRRRESRSTIARLVARLIGLDLKLRQYVLGKRFCDAVVERAGVAALHRVWESPASLPSLDELEDPESWLVRMAPSAAA